MKISVFGAGYVGAVCTACFAALGHEVIAVDVLVGKLQTIAAGKSPFVEDGMDVLMRDGVASGRITATTDTARAVSETEVSFVSVGTPSAANGDVDLTAVMKVLADIGRAMSRKQQRHTVIMRSTVPPGTAERLAIPTLVENSGLTAVRDFSYYSNPEFLREGNAVNDFHAPPFTLVGSMEGDNAGMIRDLYKDIKAPFHLVPLRVAEGAKYLSNVYHAVKLAFANEAGQVLASAGIDAREAFRIFCEDRVLNISPAYLLPGFAFGGSCLPKDVRGFLSLARNGSVKVPFLESVMPGNDAIIRKVFDEIVSHGRQKIALLGLAFKPGTDDLRESPFVVLAELLIGKGYDLKIFDRDVRLASLTGTNRAYIEREIPHIDRLMSDTPEQALEGSRLVALGHISGEDRSSLPRLLEDQIVLDLMGMTELRTHPSITYRGLCW